MEQTTNEFAAIGGTKYSARDVERTMRSVLKSPGMITDKTSLAIVGRIKFYYDRNKMSAALAKRFGTSQTRASTIFNSVRAAARGKEVEEETFARAFPDRVKTAKEQVTAELKKAFDEFENSDKNSDAYQKFTAAAELAQNRGTTLLETPQQKSNPQYVRMFSEYQTGMQNVFNKVKDEAHRQHTETVNKEMADAVKKDLKEFGNMTGLTTRGIVEPEMIR